MSSLPPSDPSDKPLDPGPAEGPGLNLTGLAHLEFRAVLLLVFMLVLLCASALYVLYARGAFEPTQRLVLVADDAEGVTVGMDMTFAGFPVGRVRGLELAPDGKARILVDVARKDAHWLRESSVFTLVRALVGGSRLRAYSGIMDDPPLPDGAVRQVLQGDAMADIPRLMSSARELLEGLTAMTSPDAPLGASLTQLKGLTERLNSPDGAVGILMGNSRDRQKLIATLDKSHTVLDEATTLIQRISGLTNHADEQTFGEGGLMPETRAAVLQLNGAMQDARASLKKLDAVLNEAQGVGANLRVGTQDLGSLRVEVDANLRKIDGLVKDLQRRWPFARKTEIQLP